MNNDELMAKMQLLANEYQKLQHEKEDIEEQLIEEREGSKKLQACMNETVRVVSDSKASLEQANKTIEDMRELIDYYEKSVIKMFENIERKVEIIVEKKEINQEEIKEMDRMLKKTKEDLINLNNMII